jgi:hypothetical protein
LISLSTLGPINVLLTLIHVAWHSSNKLPSSDGFSDARFSSSASSGRKGNAKEVNFVYSRASVAVSDKAPYLVQGRQLAG